MDKVLICGSRHYADYGKVLKHIRSLENVIVIAGGARGADTLAVKAAIECCLPFREYPAQWAKYGKSAGPRRNQLMLDMEKPSLVIAFHENIDASKGTKDMVSRAKRSGIPVFVFS